MARSFKFPIRYKILAVLSAVVIAAVAFYLYLASKVFYEDKTLLIYELNQSTVRTLASDVETSLKRVLDKLRLIATLADGAIPAAFQSEDELARVQVFENKDGEYKVTFEKTWDAYLESYKKDSAYLGRVRAAVPIPFEKVLEKGTWVRNATLDEESAPPLYTVATVVEQGETKKIIAADVRLDRTLEVFAPSGISQSYLVDSDGFILAHSDQSKVRVGMSLAGDQLTQIAVASKVRSEVKKLDELAPDRETLNSYLASYYQVGVASLAVMSKVSMSEAFAAAERLVRKSLIYAFLVITVAFMIALIFSHSLTAPIQRMLEATQRVAKGDFDSLIRISSRDELAVLANSFNSMTFDLKISRGQIEEYSRDLEKKVQDRTARLEAQNIAIKEAQEALVRTTRLASVGEIAGRAAHEVLNPLTNVTARLERVQSKNIKGDVDDVRLLKEISSAWDKAYAEGGSDGLLRTLSQPSQAIAGKTLFDEDIQNLKLLVQDLEQRLDERRSDVDFLLKEAARINKIVSGMRGLTRLSGNKRELDIHKVLQDALATMTDVLAKRKIKSELKLCEAASIVQADNDELIQVFSNLFRNSMQAIEEAKQKGSASGAIVGEPAKVWVTTEISPDQSKVLIRVCDNGPGIPEDDFQKVFEPSFTTKTVEEGTGLGLSISRRFIRAFDGEIIVEKSVPGLETAFLIELPRRQG